jgi:hypothetical protein
MRLVTAAPRWRSIQRRSKVAAVNQLIARGIEETGCPHDCLARMMGRSTSDSNGTSDDRRSGAAGRAAHPQEVVPRQDRGFEPEKHQ